MRVGHETTFSESLFHYITSPKLSRDLTKIGHTFKPKSIFQKKEKNQIFLSLNKNWSPNLIFPTKKYQKVFIIFEHWKMTWKIEMWQSLRSSLIILIGQTMTWCSEKNDDFTRCGFMPNSHKKYWMVSIIIASHK